MKPKLICLIGMDGSGKSTLAAGVSFALGKKGLHTRLIHMYHEPFLLKPAKMLARLLLLNGERASKDYTRYRRQKQASSSRFPWLATWYRRIWLLDYDLQVFFLLILPGFFARREDIYILDRYIYDTTMNISLSLGWPEEHALAATERWLLSKPVPWKLFVIDLPENVAFSRKKDISSVVYLQERRERYLRIGNVFGAQILDGQSAPDLLVEQVLAACGQE